MVEVLKIIRGFEETDDAIFFKIKIGDTKWYDCKLF